VYGDMWVWDQLNRKMHFISLKNIVYSINYIATVYHMSSPNRCSFYIYLKMMFSLFVSALYLLFVDGQS
jgi:hypothetical protein